jgi:uncharacterized protein YijF (DUF1287 family)
MFCLKKYWGFTIIFLLIFGAQTNSLAQQPTFTSKLSNAAISLTKNAVVYDPTYFKIAYPMGDVPLGKGVCTDVVIRAYRKLNIDLQRLVHEDMVLHFNIYPNRWGLKRTDTNIDHRRVPNLMVFFNRFGRSLPRTLVPTDYHTGDIVCWDLGGGITHIGIVIENRSKDGKRHLIVHNIGGGQVMEDCLFNWKIIGHYRYGA